MSAAFNGACFFSICKTSIAKGTNDSAHSLLVKPALVLGLGGLRNSHLHPGTLHGAGFDLSDGTHVDENGCYGGRRTIFVLEATFGGARHAFKGAVGGVAIDLHLQIVALGLAVAGSGKLNDID